MNMILVIAIFSLLFIIELLYFRVATYFGIIDKPNYRSSHTILTLRGGGIIFPTGLLLYPIYFGLEYPYFLAGLAIIAFISFIDDINPVNSKIRVIFHLTAVALLFFQLGIYTLPIYWIILALILVIGSINAINFMDGINGMTGAYSLITLCTLLYINVYVNEFVTSSFIITVIISVVIFNFFNFRKRARCFAGDVGSVSIAFIILFFLLQLITATENFNYLLLLILYGLDTVTTIIFRAIRRENIFEAHRSHFYQYYVNERKKNHLVVATVYALLQLIINTSVIIWLPDSNFLLVFLIVSITFIFILIRFSTEGSRRLLRR